MEAGWGAPPETGADDKKLKKYAADVQKLINKADKLHSEISTLVAMHPVGDLLKCKSIELQAKLQVQLNILAETINHMHGPAYSGYEAVRKLVLPVIMEDQNISTVRIRGVGRVDLRGDIFASTLKGGMAKVPPMNAMGQPQIGPIGEDGQPTKDGWVMGDLHDWLATMGAADLITETVNASSLKALLRQKLKDGIEVPAELIKVTPYSYAAITKG